MTLTLSSAQHEALEYALQLAADDQESYLSLGAPVNDYTPEELEQKAQTLRTVAVLCAGLNLLTLANQFHVCANMAEDYAKPEPEPERMVAAESATAAESAIVPSQPPPAKPAKPTRVQQAAKRLGNL